MKKVMISILMVLFSAELAFSGNFYPFHTEQYNNRMKRQKSAESFAKASAMLAADQRYRYREELVKQQQIKTQRMRKTKTRKVRRSRF